MIQKGREPLAIVGIACRLPGAASAEEFWTLLANGVDAVGKYPGGRVPDLDALYRDGVSSGRIATDAGGFLRNIDLFDARFFGISPREACYIDPQHRILLEVAWEAFEAAGIPSRALAGSKTGVFIGQWTSDYEACVYSAGSERDFYATTGTGRYSASGRIAFQFDLRGPALTLDTACSSSLVAIHLACRSLWNNECEMALAGGVNVILRPEVTLAYSAARMLSGGGRCKFGDASADGYVRSEGAVLLLLKPYAKAVRDGDRIHALIRGSAVNNDGASNGFLIMPSREGQTALIRAALDDAGVSPSEVLYVEAHGTGTSVGDPIEIESIGAVLGSSGGGCAVGSVKTNLGHTESAAGAAGVAKVALALERGLIPASLHHRTPNPGIDWASLGVRVQTEAAPWPLAAALPVAGVSAFGITGTNAHVVLQAAEPKTRTTRASGPFLLPLSARSPEALAGLAERYVRMCRCGTGESPAPHSGGAPDPYDLCWTAAVRRTHFPYRLAAVAGNPGELATALQARVPAARQTANPPRVVFVCPGQGSQWAGMGRELLAREPVFREQMERCDGAFRPFVDWSLLRAIEDGAFERIDIIQPALFAIQVSLAALWRSWGIQPGAVIGHSMGEAAAACIAGILTFEDAARVVCERSKLLRTVSGAGAMAMIDLPLEETRAFLRGREDNLSIAVSNSRRGTVVSGSPAALDAFIAELETREIFCRRVKVDVASHSPQMDALKAPLELSLRELRPAAATLPMYSTVSGARLNGPECDARYWFRNLRQPVLFGQVVESLIAAGHDTFVELSPHPLLLPSVQQSFDECGAPGIAVPSGRRDEPQRRVLLESLAAMYEHGLEIDWAALYPEPGEVLPLPSYPWQRERFWFESAASAPSEPDGWRRLDTATGSHIFETCISPRNASLLSDHVVRGSVVLPASFYLNYAAHFGAQLLGSGPVALENCRFREAVTLPGEATCRIQLVVASDWNFRFYAQQDGAESWSLVASGAIGRAGALTALPHTEGPMESSRDFYLQTARSGITYGPAFQVIEGYRIFADGIAAEMRPATEVALIDGALQPFLLMAADPSATSVPSFVERFERFDGQPLHVTALAGGDVTVTDAAGSVVMRATGVRFEALADDREVERFLYRLDWVQTAASPGALPDGKWTILGEGELAAALAERIRAHEKPGGRPAGIVHMWTAGGSLALAPLIQALDREAAQHPPRLYLVTRGTQAGGVNNLAGADLWGAGAVLANEHPELRCKRIDLSPGPYDGECDALLRELQSADEERAVALRPEGRFVARLARAEGHKTASVSERFQPENYRVAIARRGVLDELALEKAVRCSPGAGEIEIEVVAAGLNFVDVMKAMDLDPTQAGSGPLNLGGECAGIVRAVGDGVEDWRAGDEVIAFTPSFEQTGCFARFVRVPAGCAVRKPASLGYEEAATLPLAFITAWQSLYHAARLQRGERVLIHSAAGGVGLAAVQLARLAGAEVYATAGTEEKRDLLRSLGATGVFNSHSLSFASEILKATGGEGVDVVLNSLAGDAVERSLSILRRYGRFVEIGKRTLRQNSFIELQPFAKSLSFCAVDIASMVEDRRAEILRMLSDIVGKVETRILQPLPYTVYPASEVAQAFRFMAQGRHIGKIVLSFRDAPAVVRAGCQIVPDGTYVITGGTGALGTVAARELARLGAKHIVLLSRTGAVRADVSDYDQLARALDQIRQTCPPIRGVVHAAGVLADGVLLESTEAQFKKALDPKIRGAWNLHELTRQDPLDFFLLFSSVSALLGTAGQANYAAGNAFLDALAEYRAAAGLPATSISWGPWSDIGLAAASANRGERLGAQGLGSLSPGTGAAILRRVLESPETRVIAMDFDAGWWARAWPGDPLVAGLSSREPAAAAPETPAKDEDVTAHLQALPAGRARTAFLENQVREQIGRVLRLAPERVPVDQPLKTLGVDSLMALELRNRLERLFKLRLPASLAWNYPTVNQLVPHLASKLAPAEHVELNQALIDEISAVENLLNRT